MNDQRKPDTWLVLISVWATFLLFGLVAAPIPGVNEPHYLCKARHYWQPDWCSSDFFLASPNAHTVFYATVGSLTNVLPLEQAALVGRIIAALLLAWGWTKCLRQLFMTSWAPLWCAWIFVAFASCGNFSGEWLIGGVEGKSLSYAFLFAALGEVLCQRLRLAAAWTGLAISFHPVVGMWGLLACLFSIITQQITGLIRRRRVRTALGAIPITQSDIATISWRMIIESWLILIILSLPGLIPVIQLLTESASPQTKFAAVYLQVFFRLPHHLDPMQFPAHAYFCYAILLAFFLLSLSWGGRTNAKKQFDQIVVWVVVFAVAGILVGYGPRPPQRMPYYVLRMNLLKFYPFRLADILLPLGAAISLISVLERTLLSVPRNQRFSRSTIMMLLIVACSLWRAHSVTDRNRYSREDRHDWLDVCQWIDQHLPPDALVQSPTNGWAFKWFAHRAEYVAFKDCPQDAAGMVEWNRRLNFLQKWYEQKYADQFYSASELSELRQQTGLTHLLTDRLGPLELDPIYRNHTFQVYDLRTLDRDESEQ